MVSAVARFSALAPRYDASRPQAPAELAGLLMQWSGTAEPDVVDVGAGTGLSTVIWVGRARRVTAVEPGAGMREIALRRLGLDAARPSGVLASSAGARGSAPAGPAARPTAVSVLAGSAEATGLPGGSADIVTASQAMHWFDASRALPEIARVLRPGGVLAVFDYDWPPAIDPETDAAFGTFRERVTELERARGLQPRHAGKDHLAAIAGSGLFRYARQVALHSRESGDAQRVTDLAAALGGTEALLTAGVSENELGLAALREVAARRLPAPRPWWWTYQVRLAVK